eukprot:gene15399-biopygen651
MPAVGGAFDACCGRRRGASHTAPPEPPGARSESNNRMESLFKTHCTPASGRLGVAPHHFGKVEGVALPALLNRCVSAGPGAVQRPLRREAGVGTAFGWPRANSVVPHTVRSANLRGCPTHTSPNKKKDKGIGADAGRGGRAPPPPTQQQTTKRRPGPSGGGPVRAGAGAGQRGGGVRG